MSVLETLVTTYGLVVVAGVLGISGIVWFISHFATKPGGKVSILWGLATYDRRETADIKPDSKQDIAELQSICHGEKIVSSVDAPKSDKQILVARIEDSLLIDTETQRASNDLAVYSKGNPINQLAIVFLTIELQGKSGIPAVSLHLKRKRPGEILSALPQVLGEVSFQNTGAVSPLGILVTLRNMHPGERFRLQMLTDGLRATDFHLVQEPRTTGVELRIEKGEDWQP